MMEENAEKNLEAGNLQERKDKKTEKKIKRKKDKK
jgi:regulator of replication initiation timing